MKLVLWISFYFLTFLGIILGLYFSKDRVMEKTNQVPLLNYTQYHLDAQVEDSTYTEKIDSLAVVVEGMLTEMTNYVTQLQDRDFKIKELESKVKTLTAERTDLQDQIKKSEERKINYNQEQEEKKLQDLAKILGGMKGETLGPILANLPDRLVQIFYYKAKDRDKAKIFDALPPDRAGKILTDIAGRK